jgi:ligand-binding SRPBCC domain-containing protein
MLRVRRSFDISSVLAADADAVWAHCSSMDGVSRELWPLMRMTYPADREALGGSAFVAGRPLFRSCLLLFGVLPIDRSDLTLVELDVGRRFLERSPMLSQKLWEHERLLEPTPEGTRVTDRLRWRGRFPGAGAAFALAVPVLFRWRHRRLKRIFGSRY